MSDYHQLLAREDSLARRGFDPRVAYHNQTRLLREHMTPNRPAGQTRDLTDPDAFAAIPDGSRADSNSVQQAPNTVITKRYVVVDASQRDWTVFPNPYSNVIFTFGGQGSNNAPVPVYTNNPTYPSFALAPSNATLFTPVPGASNQRGFSYINEAGLQITVSAYNSSLPRGSLIGYDFSINAATGSGDAFGTALTPCNVGAIRLARAILPQTPFVSYPTDPFFALTASASEAKTSAAATPYNTFGTYPYLLFYLNEFRGNYYGPTEASRRAFAVLTQCNRMQLNFTLTNGPQYFDYVPWNAEGVQFQSPLTSLQKLQFTVTDPNGQPFATDQQDVMTVDSIRQAVARDPSTGQIETSTATLVCSTPAYKKYPETQLRQGDRVAFYGPTIDAMLKSPALAATTSNARAKRAFLVALKDKTFPVLNVDTYAYDASDATFLPDSNAGAVSLTDSRIDYFNVFFIPNFTQRLDNGTLQPLYPDATDQIGKTYSIIDVQNILGVGSNLPILNVTQQPVYTFELDIVSPDTSKLGGTIVN